MVVLGVDNRALCKHCGSVVDPKEKIPDNKDDYDASLPDALSETVSEVGDFFGALIAGGWMALLITIWVASLGYDDMDADWFAMELVGFGALALAILTVVLYVEYVVRRLRGK